MKITSEQKQEIKKLRAEGDNFTEISRKLNLPIGAVRYWGGERERVIEQVKKRVKKLSKQEKRKRYEKHRGYNAEYFKKRYVLDPSFREKHKERARKWSKENYWKKKQALEIKL